MLPDKIDLHAWITTTIGGNELSGLAELKCRFFHKIRPLKMLTVGQGEKFYCKKCNVVYWSKSKRARRNKYDIDITVQCKLGIPKIVGVL